MRVLPLLLMLLALPALLRAQAGGRPVVPYLAVGAGGTSLPGVFQGCSPETRLSAEIRGGLARGALAVEGRIAAMGRLEVCTYDGGAAPAFEDGLHTYREYPFEGATAHLASDLRLRLGGTRALPLVVSGGAGWLSPTGVPYLLAGAGVRLGGRVRLAVDAERSWYRVSRTDVTTEWRDYQLVREVSRRERREWLDGAGVRVGVELPFR